MIFGVAKETSAGETRVALVPDTAKNLIKKNHQIFVQKGAGITAFISDEDYVQAGCSLVSSFDELCTKSECILKVRAPNDSEVNAISEKKALISYLWALRSPELVLKLKSRKITSFSMDAIPRISRAQSMDALSSMATISGYKAVILATANLGKFMPMLTTAAGTIRPAQGFIIGAGVAGLQAIATARRLGAVVEAFDTRPAVQEQIQSLGAKFVSMPHETPHDAEDKGGYAKEHSAEFIQKEKELLASKIKAADFVITTAQIPGKKAPLLITADVVRSMKPGSVIVDLAAESGGNCELTKADQTVIENGVMILGPTNLPATMPLDASRMYSQNMMALIGQIVKDGKFSMDLTDEVFTETCITMDGEIKHPKLKL